MSDEDASVEHAVKHVTTTDYPIFHSVRPSEVSTQDCEVRLQKLEEKHIAGFGEEMIDQDSSGSEASDVHEEAD